jgi:hypothetical protein
MICGKVVYTTRREAIAAVDSLSKDRRVTRSRRQADGAYFCAPCNGYHLFTKGKRRRLKAEPLHTHSFHQKNENPNEWLTIHHKLKIK